jgi:hypothetical protein
MSTPSAQSERTKLRREASLAWNSDAANEGDYHRIGKGNEMFNLKFAAIALAAGFSLSASATCAQPKVDIIDYIVDWKQYVDQTITVTNCGIKSASQLLVACSASDARGSIVLNSDTMAREDFRRALRDCSGMAFEVGDECQAAVTGVIHTPQPVYMPNYKVMDDAHVNWKWPPPTK